MPVKARRYMDAVNDRDAIQYILNVLPFESYDGASLYYEWLGERFAGEARRLEFEATLEPFLAANDRFYLLCNVLRRKDALHEWIYDRCREVEEEPDNRLDLWARYHYKSTLITFAGVIQEIINNPEITVGIFSNTGKIAQAFLDQIKRELEDNDHLKRLFPDVFYAEPRKDSPAWASTGIIVRRRGNPKESTVEAHGVVDALPTSRHFDLLLFDDLVTENSVTATDSNQIVKTTTRFELAQNLGHGRSRRQMAGTRYSYADTYGVLMERNTVIPRVYPATHNGTMSGRPVFLSQEKWDEIKRDQKATVAAQMLLNPLAGQLNTFDVEHLRPYEVRPREMTVYILGDPAGKPRPTSDRTALPVIGIDSNSNRYLLDGYCHRMGLSERWKNLRNLFLKWKKAPFVQGVWIGYEKYGLQSDLEYFEERIYIEKIQEMSLEEVAWVREGPQSKNARISRLEPLFTESKFWLPPKVYHPDAGGICTWHVEVKQEVLMLNGEPVIDQKTGAMVTIDTPGSAEVIYTPYNGPSKAELKVRERGELFRVSEPIKRLDEEGNVYDLTRMFFEEYRLHPFAPHDDLTDAVSRHFDLEWVPPKVFERIAGQGKVFADT